MDSNQSNSLIKEKATDVQNDQKKTTDAQNDQEKTSLTEIAKIWIPSIFLIVTILCCIGMMICAIRKNMIGMTRFFVLGFFFGVVFGTTYKNDELFENFPQVFFDKAHEFLLLDI